jgi:hypothetical protein
MDSNVSNFKLLDKKSLKSLLIGINYFERFNKVFLNNNYDNIDFGKKIGVLSFDGVLNAADNYTYSNQIDESVFKEWNIILNNELSTEEELLCVVLDIFVWGNVLSGNVKTAVQLYKKKKLKHYIAIIRELLKTNLIFGKDYRSLINQGKDFEIIWSSGWTKVYSFINNDIIIYDSRVSAFLNHTLTYGANFSVEELSILKLLTKHLYNFKGAESRERLVDKSLFGFKNSNPNGYNGFNANLISSWIVELLNDELNLNKNIRLYERAFFMLGFDLSQIK